MPKFLSFRRPMMRDFWLGLLCIAILLLCTVENIKPAHSQSLGSFYTYPAQKITYSASIVGLTPASSATDLFTIKGSATKTVKITKITCTGTSTALGSQLLQITKRSTADTGGTSTAPAAIPHDKNDPAATAVVAAYTANPTLGTAVGVLRTGYLVTGTATAAGAPFTQDFGAINDKPPVLRGTADQIAVNANGASLASGASVNCNVEWTEE